MPSSEHLAAEVRKVIVEATSRFTMPSAREEYEHGEHGNRFYDETMADQLDGLEEELMDVMNWSAMAIIKLRRIRNALADDGA